MKHKCPTCGLEHESRRTTCKECGGFGFIQKLSSTTATLSSMGCNRCGGTGYEPEQPADSPGSDAALAKGCLCPVMDNNHGRGFGSPAQFWMNEDCPLHGGNTPPREDNDDSSCG